MEQKLTKLQGEINKSTIRVDFFFLHEHSAAVFVRAERGRHANAYQCEWINCGISPQRRLPTDKEELTIDACKHIYESIMQSQRSQIFKKVPTI